MSQTTASCVIKVGGSLFDLPDLPGRLANFISDFSRPYPLLVAGGGKTVDLVRRWDRLFRLQEEEAHWIAVQALTVNSLVLAASSPALRFTTRREELPAVWAKGQVPILDSYRFLKDEDDPRPDSLPRRWQVTSDSIAARMAVCLGASELVLLKSVTPSAGITLGEAARDGLVDPYFPTAARTLPRVVALNLREVDPPEVVFVKEKD